MLKGLKPYLKSKQSTSKLVSVCYQQWAAMEVARAPPHYCQVLDCRYPLLTCAAVGPRPLRTPPTFH